MPVRRLGGIIRGLEAVRERAPKHLPGDIDRRLADVVSSVGKLPGMPLNERQDFARKQRDELNLLRDMLVDLVAQGALTTAGSAQMPDIKGAIDSAMDALSDVISGIDVDISL